MNRSQILAHLSVIDKELKTIYELLSQSDPEDMYSLENKIASSISENESIPKQPKRSKPKKSIRRKEEEEEEEEGEQEERREPHEEEEEELDHEEVEKRIPPPVKYRSKSVQAHAPKYSRADLVNPSEYKVNKNGSLSGWVFLKDENGIPTSTKKYMIISGAKPREELEASKGSHQKLEIQNAPVKKNVLSNLRTKKFNSVLPQRTPPSSIGSAELQKLQKVYQYA